MNTKEWREKKKSLKEEIETLKTALEERRRLLYKHLRNPPEDLIVKVDWLEENLPDYWISRSNGSSYWFYCSSRKNKIRWEYVNDSWTLLQEGYIPLNRFISFEELQRMVLEGDPFIEDAEDRRNKL